MAKNKVPSKNLCYICQQWRADMSPFITVTEKRPNNSIPYPLPIFFCSSCLAKISKNERTILKSWDHVLGGEKLLNTWLHMPLFTGNLRLVDRKRKEIIFGDSLNAEEIKKK
ncbi:hypothetical protein NEF87_002779 [Candidatus Lokiarchaeum ossiferum]|uniref:DUF448 domain-containing protein n=1 Tax=Candidatus Lokiarchaeum ossiferum TaxID=2951803 RepID=A0ABY6HSK8_9ARCH|nr:hypothetical protein NEF87_002779 [Candidatus Lokiarchaeum sp. B-35]